MWKEGAAPCPCICSPRTVPSAPFPRASLRFCTFHRRSFRFICPRLVTRIYLACGVNTSNTHMVRPVPSCAFIIHHPCSN